MGWAGGTELFDGALDIFLKHIPEELHEELIEEWYQVFKYSDWDTEDESDYFEQLKPLLERDHPDWGWDNY